jgi:hypothetical protein
MWTTENRRRYDRDELRYPSEHIKPIIWEGECQSITLKEQCSVCPARASLPRANNGG